MDIEKIEKDVDSFLNNNGFEVVDLRIGGHSGKVLMQFFIERLQGDGRSGTPHPPDGTSPGCPHCDGGDKSPEGLPGRVTLDDCEKMSEKIGAFIDMNNIIEGAYILEVSSPGFDRIIKKEKDFCKFKGSPVKVILKKPLDGARTYYGTLDGFDSGTVILSDNLRFNLSDIEEVRLNPDFENIFKKD